MNRFHVSVAIADVLALALFLYAFSAAVDYTLQEVAAVFAAVMGAISIIGSLAAALAVALGAGSGDATRAFERHWLGLVNGAAVIVVGYWILMSVR